MSKRKMLFDRWADLTLEDLNDWAGSQIVSRGKKYQREGRVKGLAATKDGCLVAWVEGSKKYAVKVVIDEDCLLEATCTCPCDFECKHAVAVVLEYLERIKKDEPVPRVDKDDEIIQMIEEIDADHAETLPSGKVKKEIGPFLMAKTKEQVVEIVLEFTQRFPEIYQALLDRKQLDSGDTKSLVSRLRREIRKITEEPGWQNYWQEEGYTPDYSAVRSKLDKLLTAGCADEVLVLGEELMVAGTRQVGESHDEGETAMEISSCIPAIVKALEQSSLSPVDKLERAVDAILKDEYDLVGEFAEYLMQQHKARDWSLLADRLLNRLENYKSPAQKDDFSWNYHRDRLSDWTIHALECAGRTAEIIALCETEARKTGSYVRLVERLTANHCWEEAERWIHEGLRAIGQKWSGTARNLRDRLRAIRTRQQDWLAVAALRVDEFVRQPSLQGYVDCRKAAGKVKAWPQVRDGLLSCLETGTSPWKMNNWSLPATGLDAPEPSPQKQFPMLEVLIDIAIYEKKPDEVLRWYDQRPKQRYGWHYPGEDRIAEAVQDHAPERAVAIWQQLAESLIAQVKPSAYEEAANYLCKTAEVLKEQNQAGRWEDYLQKLKTTHARKRRLMEILDSLKA